MDRGDLYTEYISMMFNATAITTAGVCKVVRVKCYSISEC